MTPTDRARLQFAGMIAGSKPHHAAALVRSVSHSMPKTKPTDDRGLMDAIRFMTADQLDRACDTTNEDPHVRRLARYYRDAQRLDTIRRVMVAALERFETWDDSERVGEALAYLCHAIATGTIVDWSDETEDQGAAVIMFLRAQFPPIDPVWRSILAGERGR